MKLHPTPIRKSRERGIASILILLMVGLAMASMALGGMYYVRGLQEQSITNHALTQAQLKAWTGVEAMRQYLNNLAGVTGLSANQNVAVSGTGVSGIGITISSVATTSSNCNGQPYVVALVNGSSGGAQSNIEAHYCVGSPASPTTLTSAATITGDLTLGGDLKLVGNGLNNVTVQGNVTGNGSLYGFSSLYSSGYINIGGSTAMTTITAEGDITLSGSGTYQYVQSMGNVDLSGAVSATNIQSNGTTTLSTSSQVTLLQSIGDVTLNAGSKVTTLLTDGSVNASNATVGSVTANVNYTESSSGSAAGTAGGSVNKKNWNTAVTVVANSPVRASITPLNAQTIKAPTIDAYTYKSSANFVVEMVSGNTQVTVKSINGVPDGVYSLFGSGSHQDYLCTAGTTSYSASACPVKVCRGYSTSNSCFSYSASSGQWKLAGDTTTNQPTLLPGVWWFNGGLELSTGNFYGTFLATGDIQTSGSDETQAINYATAAKICNTTIFDTYNATRAYPTNFCASGSATSLSPNPLGNIAMLSGGFVNGTFSGGNISLGAGNNVFGDVMAGNVIKTSGNTTIHGYVVTAKQGAANSVNSFGASTTFDTSSLPTGYNPNQTPGTGGSGGATAVLWTRYR